MGVDLRFYLSHGLFSSRDIDSGTRLLLKTLAQNHDFSSTTGVLDAGCGAGIIALSIAGRFPDTSVTASDRDALALQFTGMNAALNKIPASGVRCISGLLPGRISGGSGANTRYDLIISNIPAKAGNPVIRDFLTGYTRHLNPGGKLAVVIVSTLAEMAEEALLEGGSEIVYREENSAYSVFHAAPGRNGSAGDPACSFTEIYGRSGGSIAGFFGLPEFDCPSYATQAALSLTDRLEKSESLLVWNPGIGHTAADYLEKRGGSTRSIILAGNDLLQLEASRINIRKKLTAAGKTDTEIIVMHKPRPSSLSELGTGLFDTIIASPLFIPGAGVEHEAAETFANLLSETGSLLVYGRSVDIARLESSAPRLRIDLDRKYRGFRAALAHKKRRI